MEAAVDVGVCAGMLVLVKVRVGIGKGISFVGVACGGVQAEKDENKMAIATKLQATNLLFFVCIFFSCSSLTSLGKWKASVE